MIDQYTWLRAELDKLERFARAADQHAPGRWMPLWRHVQALEMSGLGEVRAAEAASNEIALFIANLSPVHVLAGIAATRRILDRYEDALARQTDPEHSQVAADEQVREYEDWIIPLLTLRFAHRADYREEWRP